MESVELWPLPTGRTINEILDVLMPCVHGGASWAAVTACIDPTNVVEEVNAVTAASILLDRIDREVGAAQRYASRLEGYVSRNVVPAGFTDRADLQREIAGNRADEARLRALASEVDTWTRSRGATTSAAWATIDQAIQGCIFSDWGRSQPVIPSWWPRGALRPSDCKLYSADEWSALAEALMRRAMQHGVDAAAESTTLREQLTARRGASLHSSWI